MLMRLGSAEGNNSPDIVLPKNVGVDARCGTPIECLRQISDTSIGAVEQRCGTPMLRQISGGSSGASRPQSRTGPLRQISGASSGASRPQSRAGPTPPTAPSPAKGKAPRRHPTDMVGDAPKPKPKMIKEANLTLKAFLRSPAGTTRSATPGMAKGQGLPQPGMPVMPEAPREEECAVVPFEDRSQFSHQYGSTVQGIANVQECLSWMRPRRMDAGFLSSLARLGVEVDAKSRDWHSQRSPHEVVEDIPQDPVHTGEAASLLLRLVRSLPGSLPLRSMLEPLTQVLLRAIYADWSWVPSLADCDEADVSVERIMRLVPFYALMKGHEGLTEISRAEADAALAEAESLRSTTAAAVQDLAVQSKKATELEEKCNLETKARVEAENKFNNLAEAYQKLQSDMRHHLIDFTEIQNKLLESREVLRDLQKENKMKDADIAELRSQVKKLTANSMRLDEENTRNRAQLLKQKTDIEQVPQMRQQLEAYESAETVQGISFAVRILREVLGLELENICGVAEQALTTRSSSSSTNQMKVVLDTVSLKMKALPLEISNLKSDLQSLHHQVTEYRQLIPIWNQDVMQDLEDACNQDAPVHRQVFSMKDRRNFAGLGTGDDVPPYLRAEGMVRHIFVTKGELEDFMQDFHDFFFSASSEHDMSTKSMHDELHQHLKARFADKLSENPDALAEFAYTFICSLEAYRADPDFELFDLMLSGAVHPSIVKDQREMLQNIESLVKSCQEASGAAEEDKGRRKHHARHVSAQHFGVVSQEQVSRRVIRAALECVFPAKTPARHDALRRALHCTIQMLSDAAKTPSHDCVYTGDLFAATQDGSQTPLVEEVRRQHVYEVIEWTAALSEKLLKGRSVRDKAATTNDKQLMNIIGQLDPHSPRTYCQELAAIGCPRPHESEPAREVLQRLRHGILLRPKQLWVRCEPKEVVQRLLTTSQGEHQEDGEASASTSRDTRRIRALKVLDNPLKVMNSDEYNDPDTLEQVITRAPQRADRHVGSLARPPTP